MRRLIIYTVWSLLAPGVITAQSDFTPAYSPNGKQLAFYRYINKVPELMIVDVDGKNLYQLTRTTGLWSIGPHWSENGRAIYFSQGEGMAGLDVAMIDIGSREVIRTPMDGMQFFFGENEGGLLWATKESGGMSFHKATDITLHDSHSITIDGFTSYTVAGYYGESMFFTVKDEGKEGVYIKKAGANPRRIADHKKPQNLTVSKDGTKVLFESSVGNNSDIYMVNTDGTELERLTTDEAPDYMPVFSPDGKSMVFSSARSGAFFLYKMNLKTREIFRITGI